jgi:hypothetical protein
MSNNGTNLVPPQLLMLEGECDEAK